MTPKEDVALCGVWRTSYVGKALMFVVVADVIAVRVLLPPSLSDGRRSVFREWSRITSAIHSTFCGVECGTRDHTCSYSSQSGNGVEVG